MIKLMFIELKASTIRDVIKSKNNSNLKFKLENAQQNYKILFSKQSKA